MAEATERADHLVGDEQHAVAVADLAHPREVALGRREAAARVLHRLEEHRGHGLGALELDRVLDLVGDREHERLLVVRERMADAVGVGDVDAAGREWLERLRADAGTPVIASAPSVVPWYAPRRAITLWRCPCPMARKYWRASFHADSTDSEPPLVKNTRFRSPGASVGEAGRELDRGRVRVGPDREVLERLGLARGRRRQVGAAVPELHGEESGQPVEVPLAAGVLDPAALAAWR